MTAFEASFELLEDRDARAWQGATHKVLVGVAHAELVDPARSAAWVRLMIARPGTRPGCYTTPAELPCASREHAEWLRDYLIEHGTPKSAVKVARVERGGGA